MAVGGEGEAPAGRGLYIYIYIQLHARRHLPSAVPWISEDQTDGRQFIRFRPHLT